MLKFWTFVLNCKKEIKRQRELKINAEKRRRDTEERRSRMSSQSRERDKMLDSSTSLQMSSMRINSSLMNSTSASGYNFYFF